MSSQLNPNLTYWTMLQDSTNIVWATDHFQVQNFHSQGQKVTNHPLWYSKLVTTPWKSSSWTKKQMLEIGNFEKPSCYSYLFLPSYLSLEVSSHLWSVVSWQTTHSGGMAHMLPPKATHLSPVEAGGCAPERHWHHPPGVQRKLGEGIGPQDGGRW